MKDILGYLIMFGLIYLIVRPVIKGFRSEAAPKPRISRSVASEELDYSQAVVGESFYQDAIKQIKKEHGREVTAIVAPEDDNVHDVNAVVVTIKGMTVGHLSRNDAKQFRKKYNRAVRCEAMIIGGVHGKPSYGVQLELNIW